ncbi:hypothetical protein ACFXAZ_34015 [Streptomyces sp. NPDC059477]|uniref:hypothetical protein n=1 Tax=Streptomyces sp. NPDC059477 TaxID=3346847 RepID=UPI003674EDD8
MSVRRRIVLLCVSFAVLGSPWVQEPLLEFVYGDHYDDDLLRWFAGTTYVVSWDLSSERYWGTAALVVSDISAAVLILGFGLLAVRLVGRGLSGRLRSWTRCLAAGLIASELAAVVRWLLATLFVHDPTLEAGGPLSGYLRGAALDFGLLAGFLLGLLTTGLPRRAGQGFTGAASKRYATTATTATPATTATTGTAPAPRPFRRLKGTPGMTTPQVHMPVGRTPGDVTRYLCAAAHVDEDFADRVVEDVVADEVGAAAPSPDVDLVAVAHHCLAAKETRYHRDLRLAAALGVVAVCAPLWTLLPATLLAVTAAAGRSRPSLATRGSHQPGGRVLVAAALRAAAAVLGAFLAGLGLGTLALPGFPGWLLGGYGGGLPAVLISLAATAYAYVIVVRHDMGTDRELRETMTRERFYRLPLPPVPPHPWLATRLAVLREARDGNVTVYGGYSPFIGYSATSSTWSLAVPLLPADEPLDTGTATDAPRPFTVTELVDHVREHLRSVARRADDLADGPTDGPADGRPAGAEPDDGESLRSLSIEDRIFAEGTSIGDDGRFILSSQLAPAARLTPEAIEEIMLHPTGTVRHYLAVHVPLWGGDVVPSVFLHFSTAGRTLHLHCDNHVLGPVAAAYHIVDRLRGPLGKAGERGLLLAAVAHTGRVLYRAPLAALRHARFEQRHNRRMLDELTALEEDPVFDFGARVSIRELGLSPNYQNYFQVVDAARIVSTVQRHTLAAIREFLDTRGYDITDFRSQQQTILNQGLIQQGGTSIIGNQAIGTGASATQNVGRGESGAAGAAAGQQQ